MKITQNQAVREDWDAVKSWNYKLPHLSPKMSVVYAELKGDHGAVHTEGLERIYYVIEGQGEFTIGGTTVIVNAGDVITIPPKTEYGYKPINGTKLKVVLLMELWDN